MLPHGGQEAQTESYKADYVAATATYTKSLYDYTAPGWRRPGGASTTAFLALPEPLALEPANIINYNHPKKNESPRGAAQCGVVRLHRTRSSPCHAAFARHMLMDPLDHAAEVSGVT